MQMVLRQQEHMADNDPAHFGLPDEQDREDGLTRINGQTDGQLTTGRDTVLWRPGRPGFEAATFPPKHLISFGDSEMDEWANFLVEEAERVWAALQNCAWIYVPVYMTWQTNPGIDPAFDNFVIIDGMQFPPYTNWRGGLLNVVLTEGVYGIDIDAGPFTTRVPLLFNDLMIQLNIDESFYEAKVFINGVGLTPDMPGYFFRHGFYMEIIFKPPGSSSSGSHILNDLLRTPPRNDHEPGESEDPLEEDPSATSRSGSARTIHSEESSSDDDADDSRTRTTERGDDLKPPEASEVVSLSSHPSAVTTVLDIRSNSVSRSPNPSHVSISDSISVCSVHSVQASIADADPISPSLKQTWSCPKVPRRRISLELLIPGVEEPVRLDAPGLDTLKRLLHCGDLQLQHALPDDLPLKDVTKQWLAQHRIHDQDHKPVFHFYTDGSAKLAGDCSAWACVVATSTTMDDLAEDFIYHGWLSGSTIVDSCHPHFLGGCRHDSVTCEATGMFWAILFALAHREDLSQCVFHFDALSVGKAMDASFNAPVDHPIVGNLTPLMQLAESLLGPTCIHTRHVKGHTGHPLNELVNNIAFLATARALHEPPVCELNFLFEDESFILQWLWLPARKLRDKDCLPDLRADGLHVPPRHQLRSCIHSQAWTFGYGTHQPLDGLVTPSLKFMTFNTRTLRDHPTAADTTATGDAYVPGRHSLLEAQVFDYGLGIIALQETRSKTSGSSSGPRFAKYRAAADKGQGGMELWFNKDIPLCHGPHGPLFFQDKDIVVIHEDPHMLFVKWSPYKGATWLIWTAHAPHKGYSDEHKHSWWHRCRDLLRQFGHSCTIIGLLDSNAAVGSVISSAIGGLSPDEEDYNGLLFRELLQDFDLFLPATFEGIHDGPSVTWFSSAAKQPTGSRLDYVAIPHEWKAYLLDSFVMPDFDLAQLNIDHFPVILEVHAQASRPQSKPVKRSLRPDWRAIRDCRDPAKWNAVFHNLKQPPWNFDTHSHWQFCHEELTKSLAKTFPLKASRPKRPYISDETWQCRNHQRSLRRQALAQAHIFHNFDILAPFQAWRISIPLHRALINGLCALLRFQANYVKDKATYRAGQKALRQALLDQRKDYLYQVAAEAEDAPANEIYARLRKAGFCSTRKAKFRPLPMIKDVDGKTADSRDELHRIWRSYFASIEAGCEVQPDQLLDLCNYTELEQKFKPEESFLHHLPTLRSLETMLRKCNPHKAAGTDELVPELCRYATKWLSDYLAPLFLKVGVYMAEPVQWKGGVLFEIFKGKGAMDDPTSYRGILVSSHVAKAVHNAYRQPTMEQFRQHASPMQLGGLPGKGVDMASHGIRAFFQIAKARGESAALFFLDIKSAYYRLVRQLATGSTSTYAELLQLLKTLDMPKDVVYWLCKAINEPSALSQTGCPEWLCKAAAQFHRHTWYHVRGDPSLIATYRGTRPGDGYADLLFSAVMSRVLDLLQAELEEAGLCVDFEWNGAKSFHAGPGNTSSSKALSITWADDVAVMIRHGTAGQLLEALQIVIASFIDKLASRGLLLNFGRGKTEVMLLLRGPGSRQLRRDLFNCPDPKLTIETDTMGTVDIRLVVKYKHLGHTLHANGHMMTELRTRVGHANSAFQKFRTTVYTNKGLSLSKRVDIFKACVLSIFTWNSGTWPPLRKNEHTYIIGAFVRLLRRFTARDIDPKETFHWNQHRLCAYLGLLPLDDQVRVNRLGYYGRLLKSGPDELWALLANEGCWISFIRDDLKWLWANTQSQTFRPDPTTEEGHAFWCDIMCTRCNTWKGLLKKLSKHARAQIDIQLTRQFAYEDLYAFLREADMVPDDPALPEMTEATLHVCLPCQKCFRTKAGWATHSFRLHQRRAPARYLVDTNQCGACLHTFHNPYRLYLHLRTSQFCFKFLRQSGLALEPLPSRGSKIWQSEEQYSLCPFLLAEGPTGPLDALPRDMPASLSPHELDLLLALMAIESRDLPLDERITAAECYWLQMRDTVRLHPVSLEDIACTLDVWEQMIRQEQPVRRRMIPTQVKNLLEGLALTRSRLTYEWLCPNLADLDLVAPPIHGAEARLHALPWTHWTSCAPPTAGPLIQQPVLVHLYSGRRRAGDFQACVEALDWPAEAWKPIIISLDVVLDPTWGNVLSPQAQKFWLGQISKGAVHGMIAGPPCETWSVARERYYQTFMVQDQFATSTSCGA